MRDDLRLGRVLLSSMAPTQSILAGGCTVVIRGVPSLFRFFAAVMFMPLAGTPTREDLSLIRTLLAIAMLSFVAGCATLVGGGGAQVVSVTAAPSQATYTVVSSGGIEMASGGVPAMVSLPRRNQYQLEISLDGYETSTLALTRGTNGWVWVNLLWGGLPGIVIDFVTGSAYKLEPAFVSVTLDEMAGLPGSASSVFVVVELLDEDRDLIRRDTVRLQRAKTE